MWGMPPMIPGRQVGIDSSKENHPTHNTFAPDGHHLATIESGHFKILSIP
jgi:hypothetical protein